MIILIALGAFLATSLGGIFALTFKDKLHLILGFSAGAVIGVAFFDLLPEALELGTKNHAISTITALVALGFILYMLIDRFIAPHHNHDHEEHCENEHRGRLGASSLSIHSFLDGLAIGLSFQVSIALGIVVAVAVLLHDFSDGINTVSLILKNGGSKKEAWKWLFLDAIAPVVGVVVGSLFKLQESSLGIVLALFCGFFLYIGASDLLPESHHNHPTLWTTAMTIVGAGMLYLAIHFAS